MRSDKKRSGKKGTDREGSDREKLDQMSPDGKKTNEETSDQEESNKEESNKEEPNKEGSNKDGEPEEVDSPGSGPEKDSTEQAQLREFDNREEEGEDWENDDLQDDWEEESEPSKPWVMALVFFGLILGAAAICVVLWSFTHSDGQEEGDPDAFAEVTAAPEPQSQMPSGAANPPIDGQDGSAVSDSGVGGADMPEHVSDMNRVTTQDGRVLIFKDCDDMVTPKEYVNLRTEPSTSQEDATVSCRLNHGETAHRTGISEEMGWSRVEYNDQVLYVVTSYVNVVTDGQPAE